MPESSELDTLACWGALLVWYRELVLQTSFAALTTLGFCFAICICHLICLLAVPRTPRVLIPLDMCNVYYDQTPIRWRILVRSFSFFFGEQNCTNSL